MRRQWFVDGLALDDPDSRWNILLDSPPAQAPKRRVGSLELPSRSGAIIKRQGWGTALQRFRFVLRGPDVETNADLLIGALARAEILTAEVGDRMREARVIDVTLAEPERVFIDYWRLEASLTLQPFWSEVGAAILSAAKIPPGALVFAEWAGTTGDLVDGILRVKGPLTELQVIGSDGTGASLKQNVSSTQYLFIDVATFQAWLSTSATAWTPTASRVLLDYPAAGPLRLTPAADGVHLTVTGAGFGTGTEVRLRGKRWWL